MQLRILLAVLAFILCESLVCAAPKLFQTDTNSTALYALSTSRTIVVSPPSTASTTTTAVSQVQVSGDARPTATDTVTAHQSGGDEYVVLFNQRQASEANAPEILNRLGLTATHPDVSHVFNNSAFGGFIASMKSHCIDALSNMTEVQHVEKSVKISSFATTERTDAPWGLERISNENKVSGNPAHVDFTYTYDDQGALGYGVDIYIVDTGINTAHAAFGGRAIMGFSKDGLSDLNANSDQDGHGTHVAGTAAGELFGVASSANLIGVKVLGADGAGSSADTIKGLDYVVQRHDQRKTETGFVGSIASMSWGLSSTSDTLDHAISAAVDSGVHVSVAAGNQARDACAAAPASSGGSGGKAIAVGSINNNDRISSFSNTGRCVDVYAPGEKIMSTWINATNSIATLSGTSMACPHVTGIMAYLMARNSTLASSPGAMKSYLQSTALVGKLSAASSKGSISDGDTGLLVNNGQEGSSQQSMSFFKRAVRRAVSGVLGRWSETDKTTTTSIRAARHLTSGDFGHSHFWRGESVLVDIGVPLRY